MILIFKHGKYVLTPKPCKIQKMFDFNLQHHRTSPLKFNIIIEWLYHRKGGQFYINAGSGDNELFPIDQNLIEKQRWFGRGSEGCWSQLSRLSSSSETSFHSFTYFMVHSDLLITSVTSCLLSLVLYWHCMETVKLKSSKPCVCQAQRPLNEKPVSEHNDVLAIYNSISVFSHIYQISCALCSHNHPGQ